MRSILVLAIMLFAGSAAAGVVTHSVSAGDRLRIEYRADVGHRSAVGRLLSSDSSRVMIATASGDSTEIPTGLITRVDRSIGVNRHPRTGAWIGVSVGLLVAIGMASSQDLAGYDGRTALQDNTSPEDARAAGALVGGVLIGSLIGGLFGTAIGSLIATDEWQPVDLSALRIGVSAVGENHLGLALSISF